MEKNKILSVIVTHNRLAILKECIHALLSQSYSLFDILVVNNHSNDGTKDYLSSINDQRIFHVNLDSDVGSSGGFNLGIRYAFEHKYSYCWLMDDDAIPTNTALERIVDVNLEYGFLCSKVLWIDGTEAKMNVPKFNKKSSSVFRSVKQASFVSFYIPMSVIKEIGLPIKEFFIWGDDVEYSLRISDKYPCYYINESIVIHKMKANIGSSIALDTIERIDRYFYAFRNEFYIYRNRGIKGKLYYFLKCFLNFCRILFFSKEYKKKRFKVLFSGIKAGLNFHPKIEYIL